MATRTSAPMRERYIACSSPLPPTPGAPGIAELIRAWAAPKRSNEQRHRGEDVGKDDAARAPLVFHPKKRDDARRAPSRAARRRHGQPLAGRVAGHGARDARATRGATSPPIKR